ncbi:MAG: gliding motility-associated C-terminal domain-containing protein, partial [Bacteroidota bacterium]
VTWLPVPPLIIIEPSSFTGCAPVDIFFNNLSTPIDDTYTIEWDFGDGGFGDAISPDYTYQEPGTYDINVGITSPIGCFTERFFPSLIKVDSFPVADFTFGPDRITNFEPEVNFFDNSIRDVQWKWNFNDEGFSFQENPSFIFADTGQQVVELVVFTEAGCTDTIQKVVDVIPEVRYFLPNAFTPNDDTVNDEFKAVGFYRGMKDYKFAIWNRWGELVFETSDPDEGWDGRTQNGNVKMPAGVYVCLVSYRTPRGVPQEVQGYITLIK